MTQSVNLGDLLDRSRPAGATALIDCLDWERPREYSHGEIDHLAQACARGLLARGVLALGCASLIALGVGLCVAIAIGMRKKIVPRMSIQAWALSTSILMVGGSVSGL